jgi:polar amino acid transport system permease protein
MGNVFIDIVKDTAILSVIGVSELMRETQRWAQFYFRSFEFYTAAGLIYLAIVVAISAAWRAVERRLRVHLEIGTIERRRRWRSLMPTGSQPGVPA